MGARSDVGGLFADNMGLFANNVVLKHGPFAQNVSRTEVMFVGPRKNVRGPLHILLIHTSLLFHTPRSPVEDTELSTDCLHNS